MFRKKKELEIDRLFQALVKLSGSDLHLKVDRPPYVRVKGSLRTLNRGPIDDEEMNRRFGAAYSVELSHIKTSRMAEE